MIRCSLTGKNALRFFRLCFYRDLTLKGIQSYEDGHFEFSVSSRDLNVIRELRRKAKVSVRLERRKKHKALWILPVVGAAFLSAFLFLSNRILKIEISGNSCVTRESIVSFLMEQRSGYLVQMNQVNPQSLALELRKAFPELVWVSCSRKDATLYVQVKEGVTKEAPLELAESADGKCHSIAASEDARIVSIITRTGTPCVKEMDIIQKGDVLVKGEEILYDDNSEPKDVLLLPADADIIGEVELAYSNMLSTIITHKVEDEDCKSNKKYGIFINWHRFLLPKWEEFDKNKETMQYELLYEYQPFVILGEFELPIGVCVQTSKQYKMMEEPLSTVQAEELSNLYFSYFLSDLEENGVSIIRKNVIMKKEDDAYVINGTITVQKSIGIEIIQEGTSVLYEYE